MLCIILFLINSVNFAHSLIITPKKIQIVSNDQKNLSLEFQDKFIGIEELHYFLSVDDESIATVDKSLIKFKTRELKFFKGEVFSENVTIIINAKNIGRTYIYITSSHIHRNHSINKICPIALLLKNGSFDENNKEDSLEIVVILKKSSYTKLFIISIATLFFLHYINMGSALDLNIVMNVLKKPVGPTIGLICQYLFMPVISYFIGYLLFPDDIATRFGLFAFGCSPGGSASNTWVVLLNGNLNLSLTMTFISTLFSLFMIPFWLFFLGTPLMKQINLLVPYDKILFILIGMIVFLSIGLVLQNYAPIIAKRCRRILVPFSIFLISFVAILATFIYWSTILILTWKLILAAFLNLILGFSIGALLSWSAKLSKENIVAVSIETGVQNTGISILLSMTSLHEPDSDRAFIVSVAASLITPILLMLYAFYNKYKNKKEDIDKIDEE